MNTQTYEKKWKAISARLRFVSSRLYNEDSNSTELISAADKIGEAIDILKSYYGRKIAEDLFWTTNER